LPNGGVHAKPVRMYPDLASRHPHMSTHRPFSRTPHAPGWCEDHALREVEVLEQGRRGPWKAGPALATARCFLASAVGPLDGRIWAIGG
jgi:hypothetical protein